jgi:hypothetical protein
MPKEIEESNLGGLMEGYTIAVRTKRLPGHAWQENELYDVFLPIVGPKCVGLFCLMTRLAYGAEVDAPLRKLAVMNGNSKDSVRRFVLVMEAIGMLRRRSPGKYALVDLKLLTRDLGGVFLDSKARYELPVSVRDRLRGNVKRVLAESQQKSVSVRDKESPSNKPPFVSAPDSSRDKLVSTRVDSVSNGERPYIQDSRLQETIQQPPTPFEKPKGDALKQDDSLWDGEVRGNEDALQSVMDGCRFTDARLRPVIAAAMRTFARTNGQRRSLEAVATLMVRNWSDYCAMGEFLRYTWSPKKFFSHGHWCNCDGWPIDQARVNMDRGARVGVG